MMAALIAAAACSTAAMSTSGVACDALAVDTSRLPLDRRPDRTSIVMPVIDRSMPGGQVIIWSFVNTRGRVDSLRMVSSIPDRYLTEIRQAAKASRFRPAERDGCPVSVWSDSMVMAFPERR